jgi:hypothetical protein
MVKTADPILPVFRSRHDARAREAYMMKMEQEAAERGGREKKGKAGKKAVATSR